ncbi:MAG: ATP synthase F1 subunit gamma [Candidatus Marinimicrobia bacterium]|nr:ATP synthase F1 subunit gamma [Candidatus Neomarinimicrobiota bacterium]
MATLKEIKTKMSSVKGIEQVTRAMKMVATVKLRRAQEAILQARPYAYRIKDLINNCIPKIEIDINPLLAVREPSKFCVVVVTSDRGLCGSFNTNILNRSVNIIDSYGRENTSVIAVGRKARDFFTNRNYDLLAAYTGFSKELRFEHAVGITDTITSQYLSHDLDWVDVVYHEFKSAVKQDLIAERFLPLTGGDPRDDFLPGMKDKKGKEKEEVSVGISGEMLFEPSVEEVVNAIVPKYLNVQMWRILLESLASEQGARMTAMDNATESANEMIDDLQLSYNKARQSSITRELLDIVGGAEALKG